MTAPTIRKGSSSTYHVISYNYDIKFKINQIGTQLGNEESIPCHKIPLGAARGGMNFISLTTTIHGEGEKK